MEILRLKQTKMKRPKAEIFTHCLRLKKLEAYKSAKGPGARGASVKASKATARAFWTLRVLVLKNSWKSFTNHFLTNKLDDIIKQVTTHPSGP